MMIAFMAITSITLSGQKYFTREGKIAFYSDAPMEKIEAHNKKATSVIDAESGKIEFAILIKAFQFEKALMQEHFNENYMESSKYPKATFKGQIKDMSNVNLSTDGEYHVSVAGDLTIHGVTQKVETPAQIVVTDGAINAKSTFEVLVADYEIEIPSVVKDNIAKTVKIEVDIDYQPLNK